MAAPMPIKVGILNDLAAAPPDPTGIEHWLRLVVDDYRKAGRLDRDVEFIYGWGLGLPSGTAAAVEHAFRELERQDALLIIGPAIGDNALVATPLAEQYRLPTINWAGSERARGDYMFHVQVGSHEDESIVIARHLAAKGIKRIGAIHDRSPIGRRYFQFLQTEAEILGLDIASAASISPLAEDATEEMARINPIALDGFVYLGLGQAAPAVARALTATGWRGTAIMNTAGIRGYAPDFARQVDGWEYIDMVSDDNRTLAQLRERLSLPVEKSLAAAKGHDIGRLVAEGIARAPEQTREGIRDGLEQVKWLPAAQGHDGTLLGFGRHDRGALHGRYLVVRQWLEGKSVEVK